MNNRLIKSNDAGGGGGCTNTVDLYNPFPDGGGVALYQLNGDATDESGNYDGNFVNPAYGTGEFGQAGVFNGSSSYIDTTYTMPASSTYTISAWFKTSTTGTQEIIIADFDASGSGLTVRFTLGFISSNNFYINMGNGSSSWSNYTTNALPYRDGNWHNIVTVWNGTNVKLYADGNTTPIADLTSTVSAGAAGTSPLNFGRAGDVSGSYFNGSIDQVRIFSRALRPYEVEALYTEEYCTPTIVPSEHFNSFTWVGNDADNHSVTDSSVNFTPDFVWMKRRNTAADHWLFDSVRGQYKILESSTTDQENNRTTSLKSFINGGFIIDNDSAYNNASDSYVAWNFKAGGAAVTNTDGTITSQVSANTEAGFSIVSYEGNYTDNQTVGHGLGKAPDVLIVKARGKVASWPVWHKDLTSADYTLELDTTDAEASVSSRFGALPTSSVFSVGGSGFTNAQPPDSEMIAYCFAEVEGFSSFGSYVGNGSTSGPTVVTGFEPAFLLIKQSSASGEYWNIWDNKRSVENPRSDVLFPNLANAESSNQSWSDVQFLENGFQVTPSVMTPTNANGATYIYMAFAADPTAVEPSLEDSFNTVLYTGNGGTQTIGGVFEGGGSFNGSTSGINLGNGLVSSLTALSTSIWFNTDNISLNAQILLDLGYSSTGNGLQIFIQSGGNIIYRVCSGGSNVFQEIINGVISNNTWYNITATFENTTSGAYKLYLNNSLIASGNSSQTGSISFASTGLYLGHYNQTFSRFDGSINQARFFNTALTAAQVTELYEETDADSSVCDFPSGAGGIALYELNGNANDTCGTYNGTATSVTWLNNGVGFQPDLVWIKNRDAAQSNRLYDSVRGANLQLSSNQTAAESNNGGLTSFDSNGFSLDNWASVNTNTNNYVAWNWKGAEIPAINSNGSIPSVVSANPAAGFSIVSYTAPASGYFKVGHGLDVKPSMVITKVRNQTSYSWYTWHTGLTNETNSYLALNVTSAEGNSYTMWPYGFDTETFSHNVGFSAIASSTHIAYCFAEVAGFSKFGSYTGNGNAAGPTINCGFEPAFVMIKASSDAGLWAMHDNKRGNYNNGDIYARLSAQDSAAEYDGYPTDKYVEFSATGFQVTTASNSWNGSGRTYIYMAFANQF